LLIAGRDTGVLMDRITELGINENVKLLGQIPPPFMEEGEDLLAAIYTQSNVFVSSSMASGAEGLSLALLDAMRARLPVVATDISGNNDVIKNGVNGYLVKPGDEERMAAMIIEILKDRGRQDSFGQASRVEANRYSWENITKEYLSVYEKLIEERKSS